jgi:hypothetical protein
MGMPRAVFELNELTTDVRSREKGYELIVRNEGNQPFDLMSITPRIPDGVEIVEVRDPSVIATKSKHTRLCSDLAELLNDHLLITSKEYQDRKVEILQDRTRALFGSIQKSSSKFGPASIFVLYSRLFTPSLMKRIEQRTRERFNSLNFRIESEQQAQGLMEELMNADVNSTIRKIYTAKLRQLAELESELGKDVASSAIATIEPSSYYSEAYVLRFPPSTLTPKRYKISIEGSCIPEGSDKAFQANASTTAVISPRGVVLNFVTCIGALMGAALKFGIGATLAEGFVEFHKALGNALIGKEGLSAVILALIFFNIYELTDMGKKIRLDAGWRSAFFIGALCGLLNERMLDAIKAFVGF